MPRRRPRDKDFSDLLDDRTADERVDVRGDGAQKFGKRAKYQQHNKTLRTAAERMTDARLAAAKKALPIGQVVQVHSLYASVEDADDRTLLCTSRRTMRKVIAAEMGEVCVGDRVRFAQTGGTARLTESEALDGTVRELPEGVIEAVEPRETILMRIDSFDARKLDPIVANADRFLIVVSMHNPYPRWGLVDRMLVAAESGGLVPIVVVNKADLRGQADDPAGIEAAMAHYAALGIEILPTSVETGQGLAALGDLLAGYTTVLAGHSGVGKSSLVSAIDPAIDLRVGVVSETHSKGRHTTTSARRYKLSDPRGGAVIDTPGIKVFGIANVGPDQLEGFFPDIADGTAPLWRQESFDRIRDSLPSPEQGQD
jgi:ribosome biogenesis GTPase